MKCSEEHISENTEKDDLSMIKKKKLLRFWENTENEFRCLLEWPESAKRSTKYTKRAMMDEVCNQQN